LTVRDEVSSVGTHEHGGTAIEMAKRTSDEPSETRFDGILGAYGEYPLPAVRTLSDEYRDVPEPEDSDWVPPQARPGIARRIATRVTELARELAHRTRGTAGDAR
jgi:hypothetical protein